MSRINKWMGPLLGIMTVCAALGWWGGVYPQFTMVKGTYEIVNEDGSAYEGLTGSEADGREIYWTILETDRSHIRFRSRLLQRLNTLQEQRRKNYESGAQ